jgi:hypothetical protein
VETNKRRPPVRQAALSGIEQIGSENRVIAAHQFRQGKPE